MLPVYFGMVSCCSAKKDRVYTGCHQEPERKQLTSRQVAFRFLYATELGIKTLRQLAKKYELGSDISAVHTVSPDEKPIDKLLEPEVAEHLRDFLRSVGHELLASTLGKRTPAKWTADRCQQFALGYGGLEQLLVFAYNTPSGTTTALWKTGIYSGHTWLPLFPRRGEHPESPTSWGRTLAEGEETSFELAGRAFSIKCEQIREQSATILLASA